MTRALDMLGVKERGKVFARPDDPCSIGRQNCMYKIIIGIPTCTYKLCR